MSTYRPFTPYLTISLNEVGAGLGSSMWAIPSILDSAIYVLHGEHISFAFINCG